MTYSDRKSKMHVLEVILNGHQILFFFRRINVHFGVNKLFKISPSYLILILKWINNFIHVENLNRIESVDLFTWNLQVSVIQVFVSLWLGYHTAGYAKMFL